MRITIFLISLLCFTGANASEQVTWSLADINQKVHQFPQQAKQEKQVTVLLFWATWCPFCKQLMPHIQSIVHQYKDELNLQVYAMNINEDEDPQLHLRNHGYQFLLFPEAESVAEKYQIYGTPGVLIFNQDGQLIFDLRKVQVNHLVKQGASRGAKSIRLAPFWASEIRKVLESL